MSRLLSFGVLVALLSPAGLSGRPQAVRIPKPYDHAEPAALFSHWSHDRFHCYACHPSLFPAARVAFTHEDMDAGKYCGACHNGRTAWDVNEADCDQCHRE